MGSASEKHAWTKKLFAENGLLSALVGTEYQRVLADLEPVTLNFGDVLYEPTARIRHVYFPSGSLISLLTPVEGHMALEIGLVGREGMVGIPLALGIAHSPVCALVQGTGTALRMTAAHFCSENEKHGALHKALNRYIHLRIQQLTQTAACNRFHGVESRLARWLLMTRDRMNTNQIRLTQKLLGNMLGVLRVAVTNAAGALQRRKLISYQRGEIHILDGKGLEEAACSCYRIMNDMARADGASAPRHPARRTKNHRNNKLA